MQGGKTIGTPKAFPLRALVTASVIKKVTAFWRRRGFAGPSYPTVLDAVQTQGYLPDMRLKAYPHQWIPLIVLGLLLPYTYGGCVAAFSSGDGDKHRIIVNPPDDTDDNISDGFIIIVTHAAVGRKNAAALSGLTIRSDPTGFEPGISELSSSFVESGIATYRPWNFVLVMAQSLRLVKIDKTGMDSVTESGGVDGNCGGFFSYAFTLNRVSKGFGGSLSFEDYCDDETMISGNADVLGMMDPDTGDPLTATLSFENLVAGSFTLEGELSIDFSDPPILAVFTLHARDNVSGLVYWLKDYSMNITEWVGGAEIEFMGTFHHPEHGFVDIATTDAFLIHDEDDWPISGQMVIQGDNGTGALLTAISYLHCHITADTTGDGIYEWDSGVLNWADF